MRSVCSLIHRLFTRLEDLALSDAPVLIQGELGSGKLLVATELHAATRGNKKLRPLVRVTCTGLSASQVEAAFHAASEPAPRKSGEPTQPELSTKGATSRPASVLTQARGGTLILQDIAALDLSCQAILMRILNQQPSIEYAPRRIRRANRVRIVSTTRDNLTQLVRQGRFRADLYHRLAAVTLQAPSLYSRCADIPLLVEEKMEQWAAAHRCPVPILEVPALHLLTAYSWPGNIRELHNVVEQLMMTARRRPSITDNDVRELLCEVKSPPHIELPVGATLAQAEREVIMQTLAAHAGKRQQTADTLGISRRTLYEKLAQYRRAAER